MYCINDHSYDMFIVAAVGLLVVLFGKAMMKEFFCGCFQLYYKLTKPLSSKPFCAAYRYCCHCCDKSHGTK